MKEEKEYYFMDDYSDQESRYLTSDEIRLQGKMIFIKVILTIDIVTICLLTSYVISYWGGL